MSKACKKAHQSPTYVNDLNIVLCHVIGFFKYFKLQINFNLNADCYIDLSH